MTHRPCNSDSPLTLIYLHGFLSSNKAHKAQLTAAYLTTLTNPPQFLVPSLSDRPVDAIPQLHSLIENLLQRGQAIRLIGSSLGGFYATWLAQCYGFKSVLINPAIRPHALMEKYRGENVNPYSQARFALDATDIQILQQYDQASITRPDHFQVLLQMADEVLDAREASAKFHACQCFISAGGNHQFQHFEQYLLLIMPWLLAK